MKNKITIRRIQRGAPPGYSWCLIIPGGNRGPDRSGDLVTFKRTWAEAMAYALGYLDNTQRVLSEYGYRAGR